MSKSFYQLFCIVFFLFHDNGSIVVFLHLYFCYPQFFYILICIFFFGEAAPIRKKVVNYSRRQVCKTTITEKDIVMNDLNSTQQAVIMSFFAPFIDAIVDRVSEKVLEITRIKEPKFYSRKETADLLHVTLPTLSRLTKDGLIESKRVGNRVLYEANSIDEAVKKQVVFKYRRG